MPSHALFGQERRDDEREQKARGQQRLDDRDRCEPEREAT